MGCQLKQQRQQGIHSAAGGAQSSGGNANGVRRRNHSVKIGVQQPQRLQCDAQPCLRVWDNVQYKHKYGQGA
jgi:hypothetical protein